MWRSTDSDTESESDDEEEQYESDSPTRIHRLPDDLEAFGQGYHFLNAAMTQDSEDKSADTGAASIDTVEATCDQR